MGGRQFAVKISTSLRAGSLGEVEPIDHEHSVSPSAPETSSAGPKTKYCKVLIIGAGASGLQCANSLLEESSDGPTLEPKDIILLEARNRVGGRVHTREYTIPTTKKSSRKSHTQRSLDGSNQGTNSKIWIDDGAAWVHGTDPIPWYAHDTFHTTNSNQELENPVMEHVDRQSDLNEIVVGNPWTRPYSILHKTGSIVIFVEPEHETLHIEPEHETLQPKQMNGQHQMFRYQPHDHKLANEKWANSLIRASIRRHYSIMRKVSDEVDEYCNQGRGIEVNTTIPLSTTLTKLNKEVPLEETEQANAILRLTTFYQHMLTYWQGLGFGEIPIGHYRRYDGSDDNTDEGCDESDRDDDTATINRETREEDPLWDDADFDTNGDFGGSHCTVKGGMQKVIQGLSKPKIIEQIQLNKEVERIEYIDSDLDSTIPHNGGINDSPYKIRVTNKDGSVVFSESCVVTIPVGCLRENHHQVFSGTVPLSAEKIEAFEHLTMGMYKKVFLTFDSIFWPSEPSFLGMVLQEKSQYSSALGKCLLIDNFWARDGHACMEAILAGDQGRWATGKSDEEILGAVLEFLQTAMNLSKEEYNLEEMCLDCHITRWEEDPYCRGAYAALSMGGLQRHTDAMNRPEWGGCLRFAGDTCSQEFEGSVSAAIFSGRHTARGIKRYLSIQKHNHVQPTSPIDGKVVHGKSLSDNVANVRYEAYDWMELPTHVRSAARFLGYDKPMWERDIKPPSADLDWEEMSSLQQASAATLGFNKETWDTE